MLMNQLVSDSLHIQLLSKLIQHLLRFHHYKFIFIPPYIFTETVSANKKIFTETVSANKKLFTDTVSANKKLFTETLSANEILIVYL